MKNVTQKTPSGADGAREEKLLSVLDSDNKELLSHNRINLFTTNPFKLLFGCCTFTRLAEENKLKYVDTRLLETLKRIVEKNYHTRYGPLCFVLELSPARMMCFVILLFQTIRHDVVVLTKLSET